MKKQTRVARLRTSKRIKRATNIITVAMLVCPLAIGAAKVLATSTNEQPVVQEKVTTQEITDVENQSTVDVSALQTEVNIYHNLNEVDYHPVDWKYFEERITEPIIEATNILNNPTHGKEQWEIDNITQTINYAIAFLNPELVTLQAKYNEYLALNEVDYTPSSWQLFQTEVEEGFALSYTINDLYDDSIYNGLTIEPIPLTMERWESAFALLVLNDGNPIITSITIEGKTTIEIGETATLRVFDQLGNPVQATWITPDASIIEKHSTDGYSLEITGVKAGTVELSASELTTGTTVKQTITVVDEPIKPINKLNVSKLKAEIETSAKINPSEELYTKKSLDIFIKQLAQSTDDLEKANIQNDKLAKNTARDLVVGSITQEDVDASEKALTKARLGLTKNDDGNNQTVDVTKLTTELGTSKKLLKDEALYTKNSWAVFFKQYQQSSKDLEDFLAQTSSRAIQKSNFTQDDIDASMNALKTARLALEKVKKDITDPPIIKPDDKGNIDNNKSKDNNKSNNNKTDKNNKILPKTNDTNIIMTSLLGLEMSLVCGLIYWVRKRKEIL